MKIKAGISTCPNDVFIFAALIGGKVPSEYDFDFFMDDVQVLNEMALANKLDLVKISYGVVNDILDNYSLLPAGGALGYGVGPLILTKEKLDIIEVKGKIAIPGFNTTAFKVFSLFFPEKVSQCVSVRFDKIMPGIRSGEYDAGIVIHESRFTYKNYELNKVADLGELWQAKFNCPLPLGGIAMKKPLVQHAKPINNLILASLEYAYNNTKEVMEIVKNYADEMETDVMKCHIELYVNDYSKNARIGIDGISTLVGKNIFFDL